jgi:hypothetical protein
MRDDSTAETVPAAEDESGHQAASRSPLPPSAVPDEGSPKNPRKKKKKIKSEESEGG